MTTHPPSLLTSALLPSRPIPLTRSTLTALEDRRQAREAFDDLIRQAPAPTAIIHSLLRNTFKTDPLEAGLTVQHEGLHVFVSLASLAIHARHPAADTISHYADAKVHKLPARLGAVAHSPQQLVARLATLDIAEAVRLQWDSYWQGRAPGTASSRSQYACSQYLRYFECAMRLAQTAGELDNDQFGFVIALLEDPEWKFANGRPVHIEMPSVAIDALVFSLDDEGPAVLYQPSKASPFSCHATRDDLEGRLQPTPDGSITYQALDDIADGAQKLLENLLEKTLQALDHIPGSDLALHTPLALARLEDIESTYLNPQLLFNHSLPLVAETQATPSPSLFDFGSLSLDASPANRTQQIDSQLKLIARLGDSQVAHVKQLQQSLQAQCMQAEQASVDLLKSARWHSDPVSVPVSPRLIHAHQQGLSLHAQIQHALGQISGGQLNAITSLLDQGTAFPLNHTEVTAAIPFIRQRSEADDSPAWRASQALVIGTPASVTGTGSGPLLLYWLGEHGGLLSCASMAELESCLGLDAKHELLTLQATSGDVLAAMLNQMLAQGREQRQALQDAQGTNGVAEALPRLKEGLLQGLQVPAHAARAAALALWQEQAKVMTFAGTRAAKLRALPLASRQTLSQLAPHYTAAMRRAEAMLTSDLLDRDTFCQLLINKRLKQDFPDYDGSYIGLDLPRSVDRVTDLVTGGTPGTVTTKTYRPSIEREKLTLEALLLNNIDEVTGRRLNHVRLDLATTDSALKSKLATAINRDYLQAMAKDLDLAGSYETHLHAAYRGLADSDFKAALRKETLLAPLQLMLAMQSVLSQGLNLLSDEGVAIMQVAIHACSSTDYQADGHAIRLLPATLTAGGADTDHRSDTLSGITFIEDQSSGITLLYLPEHSTHPLQQFKSLEAAKVSLYERSKLDDEIDYLAGRALLGNPRAHASRLREAQARDFIGIIGVGTTLPATTSLAEHLLNAQMGHAIQGHRTSSRSNDDLWMENFTHDSTLVFTYIKLALGIVPFVGTAVGVYDLIDAVVHAVEAFTQGNIADGLEALNDVLAALIDGAIDLATGIGINSVTLRKLTRRRQLRAWLTGTAGRPRDTASNLQRVHRFAGYEHDQPGILDGLVAGSKGRFEGIYRHSSGDFIKIGHLAYEVQWDATAHTWRLKGTPLKTWKRAIALDGAGNWDSHFALYGTHQLGGGAGGGQALERLAEQLDAYWPAAIRDHLPRYLVDRHYRRQTALSAKAYADEAQLIASINRSNALVHAEAPSAQLETAFLADLELARTSYQSWDELVHISQRRRQQTPTVQKGRVAKLICERLVNLIGVKALRSRGRLAEIAAHHLALKGIEDLSEQLPLLRSRRTLIIKQLADREAMFKEMEELTAWVRRAESDPQLNASFQLYQRTLNSEFKAFYDTGHLMQAALSRKHSSVVAEYLLERLSEYEGEIHRTRETLQGLHDVQVSAPQRRQIYEQARRAYGQYKQRLQSTFASMAALFDDHYLRLLYKNLDELIDLSDTQLKRLPRSEQSSGRRSASPRLFLTTDGNWYLGEFQPASGGRPARMVTRDEHDISSFVAQGERWQPQASNASTRTRTPADLRRTIEKTLVELPAYRREILTYQRQGMLAADVEHMMVIKAEDLEHLANRLQQLDPVAPELAHIHTEAQALRSEGRTLRINQIKQHAEPNQGTWNFCSNRSKSFCGVPEGGSS